MDVLNKPVILVGAMRSGTTLLADLLGESSQIIHCPFELKDVWSKVGGVQMASPKTRDTLCHELGAQDVQLGQREKLTTAFMERMAANSSGKSLNAVFLNKNPHLCNKLPFVDALFPDARFIWIYRHMPSVVSSLCSLFEDVNRRQQTWHYWPEFQRIEVNRCWSAYHIPVPDGIDITRCFPGGDVRYLAEYWLESNRAVATFFANLPPERQLIVQEEALIEKPNEQLEKCFKFLGLSQSVHSDVSGTIDTNRNNVWGETLSEQSLRTLLEFVENNSQIIDTIFHGRDFALEYAQKFKNVIAHRIGAGKRNDQLVIKEQSQIEAITNIGQARDQISGKQLILGCVTENTPKYLSQTLRLLQSLRWFGGAIANAPFRVCSIEGVDASYRRQFEKYGATIHIVSRYDAKCAVTNKIRFLQQDDIYDYETVALLDCDTIIVQDPSPWLTSNIFKAKIADLPTMPYERFTKLFSLFGVPLPSETHSCTVTGEPTIAYFNTGVLFLPKSALLKLVPAWIACTDKLLQNIELIKGLEHYCEQASMSVAVSSVGEQFQPLGNEMNFPTHHIIESQLLHDVDPVIIHYHSCFNSDGYIHGTKYPLVNKRIIQFNNRLHAERDKSNYSNIL